MMARKYGTEGGDEAARDSVTHAEVMRSSASGSYARDRDRGRPPEPTPAKPSDDEKMSLFWRVFGGTILSIVALVAVTLYNGLTGSITELRGELHRLSEAKADLIKKDEFNGRWTQMWTRVQELAAVQVTVTALKEQFTQTCDRLSTAQKEGKDGLDATRTAVGTMREAMLALEAANKQDEKDRLALSQVQASVQAMSEKLLARELQLKEAEGERKGLEREILGLRERLAKLEVASEGRKTVTASRPVSPPRVTPVSAPAPMTVPGYEALPEPRNGG